MQHSCLGRIKSKLVALPDTIVLSQWFPTTKLCSNCGTIVEMSEERDLYAAKNMIRIYNILVGVGCTDFKRQSKSLRQTIALAFSEVEDTTL